MRRRWIGFGLGLGLAALMLITALAVSSTQQGVNASGYRQDDAPTYYRDVEPILAANCLGCHGEGGIGNAELALDDVDTVLRKAADIARATSVGFMPPWPPGPNSQPMLHERRLTDDDIATLLAWSRAGAPLGDIADRPAPDSTPSVQGIRQDLVLTMPVPYEPMGEMDDDYRCFLLEPDFDQDTYITGMDIIPGQSSIVHHVLIFQAPPQAQRQIDRINGADDRPGWECFGGPGVSTGGGSQAEFNMVRFIEALEDQGVTLEQLADELGIDNRTSFRDQTWPDVLAALEALGVDLAQLIRDMDMDPAQNGAVNGTLGGWAPGAAGVLHPDGTGMLVPAENLLIMQVHYNLSAPPVPDQTTLVLQLAAPDADIVPLVMTSLVAPVEIPCPAGLESDDCDRARGETQTSDGLLALCGKTLDDYDNQDAANATSDCDRNLLTAGWIVNVAPHMHELGQHITVTLHPGTPAEVTIIDIPDWDFHWQGFYQLAQPVPVAAGDVIRLTCSWDNSAGDRYVVWGEGTADEMCLNYVTVLPMAEGKTLADFGYDE